MGTDDEGREGRREGNSGGENFSGAGLRREGKGISDVGAKWLGCRCVRRDGARGSLSLSHHPGIQTHSCVGGILPGMYIQATLQSQF